MRQTILVGDDHARRRLVQEPAGAERLEIGPVASHALLTTLQGQTPDLNWHSPAFPPVPEPPCPTPRAPPSA
jgi:hypothetical protein